MAKWKYLLAVPLTLMQLPPQFALAQQAPPAQQTLPTQTDSNAPAYTQEQLQQILAPIALYPDELLTQVLAASTYPLEVAMADRWLEQPQNKSLKDDALVKALDDQNWDPSVKSLVPFPVVLKTMSDQLDWTQKLGDAFLAQQADVLAAVQALRARAQAAGKLQSNAQQVVTQDASAIVIAPAQPSTVYVPAYDPGVVYGTWPYPAYPPAYYPPPPGYYVGSALAAGLAFGAGIAITGALWGWGRPNWGGGSINVNVNRFNSINSNQFNNFHSSNRSITSNNWQHNADHRRGLAYSNNQVRQQYRPNQGSNVAQRDAFRGRQSPGQSGLGGGNLQGRMPNASQAGGGARNNLQGRLPNGSPGGSGGGLQGKRPNRFTAWWRCGHEAERSAPERRWQHRGAATKHATSVRRWRCLSGCWRQRCHRTCPSRAGPLKPRQHGRYRRRWRPRRSWWWWWRRWGSQRRRWGSR